MTFLFLIVCFLILLVIVSFGVEALRQRPNAPTTLYWAPKTPIQTATIGGNTIRYIKTGSGPKLVLLHTLRTQLDIFEKLVPLLSKSFTVYALDYPGHGFSDIPKTDYDPDLFVKSVEGFLDKSQRRYACRNFHRWRYSSDHRCEAEPAGCKGYCHQSL